MECKSNSGSTGQRKSSGFNRNIVECKYVAISGGNSNRECFNRNIVECKWMALLSYQGKEEVLIETLWNVNAEGTFWEWAEHSF